MRQRGEVAAEAVLLGELILRQLRVLAVGDVAIHLQAHHVVIQQDFQLLELRFHRLAPGGDRLRHRAALPFVQLELLVDDVLAVIELRLQRVETLQHRAKLGADAVDALQRQRGQIRKLQLLQAPLQRQQLMLAVSEKNLRIDQRQLNIAVKPRLTAQTAAV